MTKHNNTPAVTDMHSSLHTHAYCRFCINDADTKHGSDFLTKEINYRCSVYPSQQTRHPLAFCCIFGHMTRPMAETSQLISFIPNKKKTEIHNGEPDGIRPILLLSQWLGR